MTEQKQPEALRIATTLDALDDFQFNKASAALLAHQYTEITELRAKLDELEKQEPVGGFILSKADNETRFKFAPTLDMLHDYQAEGFAVTPVYLAAGARPVEPVQKLRPDFIAGYDAGMADAKRIQAAQPAPARVQQPAIMPAGESAPAAKEEPN